MPRKLEESVLRVDLQLASIVEQYLAGNRQKARSTGRDSYEHPFCPAYLP